MKTQPSLIKLLIAGIILTSVFIIVLMVQKSFNKLDTVILRFQPPKAAYPIRKVQFISILVYMPEGKQVSGVDLFLKAQGIAIESAGSIEPLDPDTGVFNQIIREKTQDGYHISFVSLQEERLLPRTANIHLAVERSEPGDVIISIDKEKTTIVGTPGNKAFKIDSDSAQFSFR